MRSRDLALLVARGFSEDDLDELARSVTRCDEAKNFPVAAVLIAHVANAVACDWTGRPVPKHEAEEVQAVLREPLRSLLEALDRGVEGDVAQKAKALATAYLRSFRS
jgi:hypothetical protein